MTQSRRRTTAWLLITLLATLGVRWWDPLQSGQTSAGEDIAQPVVRSASGQPEGSPGVPQVYGTSGAVSSPASASASTSTSVTTADVSWPLRAPSDSRHQSIGNAFMSRTEVLASLRPPPPPPPPPVVQAPPPPPPPPVAPPEPAPPLQVIGTWGSADQPEVFLSGPQGTLMAHIGDKLLGLYKVTGITKQDIKLIQENNQRTWTLPIPVAPAAQPQVRAP